MIAPNSVSNAFGGEWQEPTDAGDANAEDDAPKALSMFCWLFAQLPQVLTKWVGLLSGACIGAQMSLALAGGTVRDRTCQSERLANAVYGRQRRRPIMAVLILMGAR